MYAESMRMVAKMEANLEEHGEAELTLLADMKLSQTIMDEMQPEYPARYKMEQTMFETFTPEQKDFICAQIGWWYTMWKDRMWVDDKPNQHWLGRGKEDLKTMICGD
jgi:hypothetical protein